MIVISHKTTYSTWPRPGRPHSPSLHRTLFSEEYSARLHSGTASDTLERNTQGANTDSKLHALLVNKKDCNSTLDL